jgi:dTDP-glucose 4,6-dehydratase
MAYHTFHGVETRIVRIFNTYGPRMRLNDGRDSCIYRSGNVGGSNHFCNGMQTRSFCYVDDQVEGILLLHSDYVYPVNIGNPDEITIKDFAEEIIKLTGTNQKLYIMLCQKMILCNVSQTSLRPKKFRLGRYSKSCRRNENNL